MAEGIAVGNGHLMPENPNSSEANSLYTTGSPPCTQLLHQAQTGWPGCTHVTVPLLLKPPGFPTSPTPSLSLKLSEGERGVKHCFQRQRAGATQGGLQSPGGMGVAASVLSAGWWRREGRGCACCWCSEGAPPPPQKSPTGGAPPHPAFFSIAFPATFLPLPPQFSLTWRVWF